MKMNTQRKRNKRRFKKIPLAIRKKLAKKSYKANMRSVLNLPDDAPVPQFFIDEKGNKYYNKPVLESSIQSIRKNYAEKQNIEDK